jgi:hypothetical protein
VRWFGRGLMILGLPWTSWVLLFVGVGLGLGISLRFYWAHRGDR